MSSLAEQFKEQLNKQDTVRAKNLEAGRKNFRTFCNLDRKSVV